MPYAHDWDENKKIPASLYIKAGSSGLLSCIVGNPIPKEYLPVARLIGDVDPEEFDAFHEFIVCDELSRCGSGGVTWGLLGGLGIGLPPIIKFGDKSLKDRIVPDCIAGKKFICLAITEPSAGSDVAGLTTSARKTPDGKHYIVNGEKVCCSFLHLIFPLIAVLTLNLRNGSQTVCLPTISPLLSAPAATAWVVSPSS